MLRKLRAPAFELQVGTIHRRRPDLLAPELLHSQLSTGVLADGPVIMPNGGSRVVVTETHATAQPASEALAAAQKLIRERAP
jgi:hypothetical protein